MENMRNIRLLFGISVSILLIISQTLHVAAANNQGLEWGVAINDQFDYSLTATYHNATLDLNIDDGMNVNITGLPTIPDDVTSLAQITFLDFDTFWDNGTDQHDFWANVMHYVPFYVYPLGNWSLIESLWDIEVSQDATSFTATVDSSDFHNYTVTILKSDGVLAHLRAEWIRSDDSLSFELIRDGYTVPTASTTTTTGTTTSTTSTSSTTTTTTTGDTTLFLIIGVGVAVVVLV
ncbi:MAG: hypothetical protein ACFFEV_03790, partial [Candidatus Thorarchaeota archaeon]